MIPPLDEICKKQSHAAGLDGAVLNVPQIETRFDKASPMVGHITEKQNAPADGRGIPFPCHHCI